MTAEPDVEPGSVRVAGVVCVVDDADVKIWEVDTVTKYAEIVVVHSGVGSVGLLLGATDRSIGADPNLAGPTKIEFPLPGDDIWTAVADGGRYSWVLVAYRRREGAVVWTRDMDADHRRR